MLTVPSKNDNYALSMETDYSSSVIGITGYKDSY